MYDGAHQLAGGSLVDGKIIYSVFDWNNTGGKGFYWYFEGPGTKFGTRPQPAHKVSDRAGHRLEDLLPTVPAGSKPVGRGNVPRGRVAVLGPEQRSLFGAVDMPETGNPLVDRPWLTIGLWIGGVLLAYKAATWVGVRIAKGGA